MSTPTASTVSAPREAYRLRLEPNGQSWTARENLADIIGRELLGPASGPAEILEGSPDAAYLIGRIAPQQLTGGDGDPVEAASAEADTDVGDAEDARAGRGVPVTAVEENGAGADESAA